MFRHSTAAQTCTPGGARTTGGFTLLEVIIAIGLMSLLMLAVYSALNLYWKSADAGRKEMKRSQLARAIVQKIAVELRSVVFARQDEPALSDDRTDESFGSADEAEFMIVDPDAFQASTSGGLAGTSDQLVMHVNQPVRPAASGSTSALRTIRYFIASDRGHEVSAAAARSLGPDVESSVKGLTRVESESFRMQTALDEVDALADTAQLLAPEVISLGFAYYDGGEMYEEWDSSVAKRLPQAVEIILGFRNPDPPERLPSRNVEIPVWRYRLVVAIPLSKPQIETF